MKLTYAEWREMHKRLDALDALNEAYWAIIDHNFSDRRKNAIIRWCKMIEKV